MGVEQLQHWVKTIVTTTVVIVLTWFHKKKTTNNETKGINFGTKGCTQHTPTQSKLIRLNGAELKRSHKQIIRLRVGILVGNKPLILMSKLNSILAALGI